MHLVIVFLGVLLFPKASAVKCYVCITEGATGTCTDTQDCPASQKCGATTFKTYVGGINVDGKMKGCMPSAACDLIGSVNDGNNRILLSSKCCSTTLCNVQYPTPPTSPSTNGKKCYTCKDNDCSDMLSCSGLEDRCFSGRVEVGGSETITKGCISKSLCVASDTQAIPGMTTQAGCCEGDLCNSATSTAVSLLLLVAPVVSVALFN